MTMEELEKIINEIFDNSKNKKERVFNIVTGCKTYGYINLAKINSCNDLECYPCQSFKKTMESESQKWINKCK